MVPINKATTQVANAARSAAVAIMTSVTENRHLLSDILPAAVEPLSPGDRARAQRLAVEALRWSGRSDRMLGPFLRRKPEDGILNVLRLAIWELFGDGAAPHGVVDSAVSLTRSQNPRATGMVNAVLRNILRHDPDWSSLPLPQLPKTLRKRLIADWGKDAVTRFEAAHVAGAPLDLTPRSVGTVSLAAATGGQLLPTGSVRLYDGAQVSALPGYADGDFWVQDAAAAIPARMLSVQKGDRVLDLCAAPGGKTLQLVDGGAEVTSVDSSASRMERLSENLARTGMTCEVVVADALTYESAELFDAILLDAPCSATGTIRRHPDLPHARPDPDIDQLVELQGRLFDRAMELAKPGGDLVYCTCSLLKSEGERQLQSALERHPGIEVVAPTFAGIENEWVTDAGALRLRPDFWPERGGMDGFFAAHVRKPA